MGELTQQFNPRSLQPQRWDAPFSVEMTTDTVARVMQYPPFSEMDPAGFPPRLPLQGILKNDSRIRRYKAGDIVVREGEHGTSAFVILSGSVRVDTGPDISTATPAGSGGSQNKVINTLRSWWQKTDYPEYRAKVRATENDVLGLRGFDSEARVFFKDVESAFKGRTTIELNSGEMFGEIASLSRSERTTTVFADGEAEVLEIRWQGLRDMRKWAKTFRERVDDLYRKNRLQTQLKKSPIFSHLSEQSLTELTAIIEFESYGDFDWYITYRDKNVLPPTELINSEPLIVSEGDYPDSLILISSGFVRLSTVENHGHRTTGYLGQGSVYGLEELASNWSGSPFQPLGNTLRAIGYADILRVPAKAVEDLILSEMPDIELQALITSSEAAKRTKREDSETGMEPGMMEFLVERRYMNGTATMVIDLDRCVRCDECVNACAVSHNNNPRFNRHGHRHDHYMVANACMHCADPVCLIGCPTGAIGRLPPTGEIVIDDVTCIGCSTCADACPYDNIRMVEIRNRNGEMIVDQDTNLPIQKATKCDLCESQLGGPACQRACPHDALTRVNMGELPKLEAWLER